MKKVKVLLTLYFLFTLVIDWAITTALVLLICMAGNLEFSLHVTVLTWGVSVVLRLLSDLIDGKIKEGRRKSGK